MAGRRTGIAEGCVSFYDIAQSSADKAFLAASGLRPGAMRDHSERLLKNGRWYTFTRETFTTKVGYGDLGWADLEHVAAILEPAAAFLALPESPGSGQHVPTTHHSAGEHSEWCWYDRADCAPGPGLDSLCFGASYCVLDGEVHIIDKYNTANRLGYIWTQRGYRRTRTGKYFSTGKLRLRAITSSELETVLIERIVGHGAISGRAISG
jgi:hypothetical protein